VGPARCRWPGDRSGRPERRAWLLDRGAVGRLRAPVERLLADPKTLAAAARLLLDLHFTPVLAELICAAVDLDVPTLDLAAAGGPAQPTRLRPRRRGFAEEVLRAYAYQCGMCGFDGALGSLLFLEVKGRTQGAETFTVTRSEIGVGRNMPGQHILALAEVPATGFPDIRYIHGAFRDIGDLPFDAVSVNLYWRSYFDRGEVPA